VAALPPGGSETDKGEEFTGLGVEKEEIGGELGMLPRSAFRFSRAALKAANLSSVLWGRRCWLLAVGGEAAGVVAEGTAGRGCLTWVDISVFWVG
jgi:hypothetical protein